MRTVSPAFAGSAVSTNLKFAWRIAPNTLPADVYEKIAGSVSGTPTMTTGLAAPLLVTCTRATRSVVQGTWKLICCCPFTLSTAKMGAVTPLTVTETFWSWAGSGKEELRLIPEADVRFEPKMVAISPATMPPGPKLAPFTTPLDVKLGGFPGGIEACPATLATVEFPSAM